MSSAPSLNDTSHRSRGEYSPCAYQERSPQLSWLQPTTKVQPLRKLWFIGAKIGCPSDKKSGCFVQIFSLDTDDALNYGGIGSAIGHQLTHEFRRSRRTYDEHGNLRL